MRDCEPSITASPPEATPKPFSFAQALAALSPEGLKPTAEMSGHLSFEQHNTTSIEAMASNLLEVASWNIPQLQNL